MKEKAKVRSVEIIKGSGKFVQEYLEENIEIGEAKAIKVGEERKVN